MIDIWQKTLAQLEGQTTKATYSTWLAGTRLVDIQKSFLDADVYIVEVASPMAKDWLEHRLKDPIAHTLAGVVGEPVSVEFIVKKQVAFEPIDEPDELDEPDIPDAEFTGIYHDKRNAIIQPKKVSVYSKYFERKWRPLLGPLLTELIRDLQQRCHRRSGRNTFKTTYKDLAKALGVSEKTIKRALARNEAGNFKNEHLAYFIRDIETLKSSDGRGKVRNLGSRFTIYLDDPLTPIDEAELSRGTK
jgi:hypothetical protein